MPYRARTSGTLIEALEAMFEGRSRRDLRRLLRAGGVLVNGIPQSSPARAVIAGDAIECGQARRPITVHSRVRVLHEDDHIFVVEKAAGILSSGGVRGKASTVEEVLRVYLERKGIRRAVRVCHRLDRDVSGLLLAAKDPRLAEEVRNDIKRHLPERVYLAVVEGVPREPSGIIRTYVRDESDKVVRSVSAPGEGKLAVTHYRVIRAGHGRALVEARLETGRKNQIRVHMSHIGHPIAGDKKYGARTDPEGRVCLHATRLTIVHPVTGATLTFESAAPPGF